MPREAGADLRMLEVDLVDDATNCGFTAAHIVTLGAAHAAHAASDRGRAPGAGRAHSRHDAAGHGHEKAARGHGPLARGADACKTSCFS